MKWCTTLPYVGEHFPPDRGANAGWKRPYIIEQRMVSSHSPLPSIRETEEALHCRGWQLMVHGAVEMEGSLRAGDEQEGRGQTRQVCMCVALSWWTHELLCFKYVHIYSHMHVCACNWKVSAVLYGFDKHAPLSKLPGKISFCSNTDLCCQGH